MTWLCAVLHIRHRRAGPTARPYPSDQSAAAAARGSLPRSPHTIAGPKSGSHRAPGGRDRVSRRVEFDHALKMRCGVRIAALTHPPSASRIGVAFKPAWVVGSAICSSPVLSASALANSGRRPAVAREEPVSAQPPGLRDRGLDRIMHPRAHEDDASGRFKPVRQCLGRLGPLWLRQTQHVREPEAGEPPRRPQDPCRQLSGRGLDAGWR